MAELRDTIRTNWSTTGQELGKELRQLWQNSRPTSPARSSMDLGTKGQPVSPGTGNGYGNGNIFGIGGSKTPQHLDIPSRPESPGVVGRSEDFATGYSLGLFGGVRSWVSSSIFDPLSSLICRNVTITPNDISLSSSCSSGKSVQFLINLHGR